MQQLGIEIPLALAPMAGTTESVFRRICLEQGAGLVTSELVSARGIVHDNDLQRSKRYLDFSADEHPLALQLFGSDAEDFKQATQILLEHPKYRHCDWIDINMGCPVPKVVKQGSGSALMLQPQKAYAIMATTVEEAARYHKPVSVKIRSGWDQQNLNCVEIAHLAESAGIKMLAIHARTRDQFYAGSADYTQIAAVKQALTIPVWGNGDVRDSYSYQAMLQTGCDGVMIGRAAQGRPWIFRELLSDTPLSSSEKRSLIKRHVSGLVDMHGEYTGIREFRTQLAFYTKGMRHGAQIRASIFSLETMQEILAQIDQLEFID